MDSLRALRLVGIVRRVTVDPSKPVCPGSLIYTRVIASLSPDKSDSAPFTASFSSVSLLVYVLVLFNDNVTKLRPRSSFQFCIAARVLSGLRLFEIDAKEGNLGKTTAHEEIFFVSRFGCLLLLFMSHIIIIICVSVQTTRNNPFNFYNFCVATFLIKLVFYHKYLCACRL